MKVEELRTEGRVYRRCFSRLGTAVVGRANAGGTTTAVRKMRGRSGLHVPRAQGARGGQGLACVEGHRGRVCFPCGGGSRLGCAALGKVLRCRCFLAAVCVFLVAVVQGWDARRWVRFCDVGVFWPRCVFSWEVYKVGMRASRGKLGQAGRNLCAGSGEIPKTLEKAVEGIALRGGFGL